MRILQFFKNQISYLRNGNFTAIFLFLWFPISVPAALFIRLLRPFALIRLFRIEGYCMGALVGRPDIYLRSKELMLDLHEERNWDFFYVGSKVANAQLLVMWKRLLPRIYENWSYWFLYSVEWVTCKIPYWEDYIIGKHQTDPLLGSLPPYLCFTDEEETYGKAQRLEMDLPEGVPFVCLLVRDNAYMSNFLPEIDDRVNEIRNCDIDNFVLAAEEIVRLGYYVVRMGAKVAKPFQVDNEKIIDYASSSFRSEFMDIFMAKNCDLFISTGCGFDLVANYLFNKPALYFNLFRMSEIFEFRGVPVFTIKACFDSFSGQRLSAREWFNRKSLRTDLRDVSVRYVENSPEEIRDATIEAIERLQGIWKPYPEDEELQKRFWKLFPETIKEVPGNFSAHFLRKNHEWFLK